MEFLLLVDVDKQLCHKLSFDFSLNCILNQNRKSIVEDVPVLKYPKKSKDKKLTNIFKDCRDVEEKI